MATSSTTPESTGGNKIEIKYGEWISQAFEIYKQNFADLLIVSAIYSVIVAVASPCFVPLLVVGGPITAGLLYCLLRGMGEKPSPLGEDFSRLAILCSSIVRPRMQFMT